MNDETEHRTPQRISPEKAIAVVISAAALAFSIGSAALAVYDRILDDLDVISRDVSVLETRVDGYYRERAPYVDRLIELERKQAAAVDRLGFLSERLARCERDEAKRP